MILRDGKFYEGDTVVPLEFGNKEQIRLMQEQMRLIADLKDGLVVEPDIEEITTYSATVRFKCVCGHSISREFDELEEDDPFEVARRFDGRSKDCHKCQRKYIFSINEDLDLIVKLAEEVANG